MSIILGHSDVSTTMKYPHLLTEDVQRPHQALSVLARLRRKRLRPAARPTSGCKLIQRSGATIRVGRNA
jgi:hypothetical protein